jgi:hypothetical protein
MTRTAETSADRDQDHSEIRIDRLLGRQVLAANGRPAGRLEEFRAERRDDDYVITEYVIGLVGLAARFGVAVRALIGSPSGGYIARWDQLDLSNAETPRLTCSVDELRRLDTESKPSGY